MPALKNSFSPKRTYKDEDGADQPGKLENIPAHCEQKWYNLKKVV
jgi:hypothetical protein